MKKHRGRRRGGGGNPKDSDNHDNPDMKARVQKVYRHFRTATMGGCNGRSTGHDGSLSPVWMFRVLEVLGVFGETVVDLGASDGRVLASALACGADKVFGHELPENKACKFVFDAVLKRMDSTSGKADPSYYSRRACWFPDDIDRVLICLFLRFLSPPHHGIPDSRTQNPRFYRHHLSFQGIPDHPGPNDSLLSN
jgi:hypothetical protein